MNNDHETLAHLRLALMPHIGAETFSLLTGHYGSAQTVWAEEDEVAAILPPKARSAWYTRRQEAFAAADAALQWAQQDNCRLLLCTDTDFPHKLTQGITPPPLLFLRGDPQVLVQDGIAVVGSRHATAPALRTAADFAASLAGQGLCTISGMAAGIDTAAHQGALAANGKTVAVWGTGIDRVYPPANRELAQRIAETGCIISEFPLGTRPLAGNFPRRNRLIAALGHAVLVVEAAIESGSLITARLAAEMGREVFAIPGSVHNPHSKGCHALIKQGAKLTETLQDILDECPHLAGNTTPPVPAAQTATASPPPPRNRQPEEQPNESALLRLIGYDPVHPDTLAEQLGLPAADLYEELMLLEIEGILTPMPGGRYQRTRP